MSEAYIIAACRTPIGNAFRGSLVDVSAFELARSVVAEAAKRSRAPMAAFDDMIIGEALCGGGDIARHVALDCGLTGAAGYALNRWCASGLTAVTNGAAAVRSGMADLVIAGGTQSTSTQPVARRRVLGTDAEWEDPWSSPSHAGTPQAPNEDMPLGIGWNTAQALSLGREEMDAWALRSHRRAVASSDRGAFDEEIVPLDVVGRDGERRVFNRDEGPRRDTSPERLAALKPLHPEIEGFSITAGNSSGVNDAAAAVVLASEQAVRTHGLLAVATIRSWAAVGVDPVETGLAPLLAIEKALRRAGLDLGAIDLFEINEAFASVPLAACRLLGLDEEIVNVNGSGCSLGHPVAATGARMVATMIPELRRRGGGLGVVAMCAAGGMAAAGVIEVFG